VSERGPDFGHALHAVFAKSLWSLVVQLSAVCCEFVICCVYRSAQLLEIDVTRQAQVLSVWALVTFERDI